jgi:hypothetical protein
MARTSNNEFTSPVSVTVSVTIEVDGLENHPSLAEAIVTAVKDLV